MRKLKLLVYKLLFLFILLAALFIFLLTTTAGLFITAKLAKIILPGEFYTENPSGQLIDHFSFAKLSYKNEKFELNLTNLTLNWRWKALLNHQFFVENLKADLLEITSKNQNKSSFNLPKLPLELNLNNIVIDKVQLNNTQFDNLTMQAKFDNQLWQISKFNFNFAKLNFAMQAQGQPFYPYALSAKLLFNRSQFGQEIKGFVDIGGDFSLYHWHAELTSPTNLVINGTLKDGSELNSLAKWLNFVWPLNDNQSLQSPEGSIQISGKIPDLNFSLLTTTKAPLAANLQVNATSSTHGFISNAEIKIPKGFLRFNLLFDELQNPKIQGKIEARNFDLMGVKLPLRALNFNSKFQGDSAKNLEINSDFNAVYFANLLKGKMLYQSQQLNAEFNLGKNQLLLSGSPPYGWQIKARLPEPKLLHPELKGLVELNPVEINWQNRNNNWDLQGSITAEGQPLSLKGKGRLTPHLIGSINIDASNFPLVKTDEYLINLSPQLVLTLSPKSLAIKGKILVPNAQIKPKTFDNTVNLSGDAVFACAKPKASNPLPFNTDIRLEMGDDVALNVKGLQGFLTGSIQLLKAPQSELKASGTLTVRDGKYKAYGQDLTIDQGELLFTGGLIDNPGINVRASRSFNNASSLVKKSHLVNFNSANLQTLDLNEDTTVGVLVTGRLKSPRIELFSEPSTLSQPDILSMLILGKPASQANKAGGQLLLTAINSMNLGSDSRGLKLVEQLKQSIGVDVDFQTNTKFDQQTKKVTDSNSVVVGKSLTKRMYLSYNFGLADSDANVGTLTYLLNKYFSLQVNASVNASSIDLLYTHKKDNSK